MNNLKEYIRKQVNKVIINELFDNSIAIDNEIELVENNNSHVEFKYIEPNTKDIYSFNFYNHNYGTDHDKNSFDFSFMKNQEFILTNDNIQYKILSVMNKVISMFVNLKPDTYLIKYDVDKNEPKRRIIYNAIFAKNGFNEKKSGIYGTQLDVWLVKNKSNKSNKLNELFDGNLSLDNEIEVVTNSSFKTEFHYIEPNTQDIYEFVFMKESSNFKGNEYRFLFSKNDEYNLTNDNIQYKILTVMNKCIAMFVKFKPNVNIITYSIDEDELKRRNVYNAIFAKHGFKETNSYKIKSDNYSFMVKLEKI